MPDLAPLYFTWTGEAMVPVNATMAQRQFAVNERYRLEHREDRSAASHGHYFAALTEAFDNLPEPLAGRFATVEHFRKFCLIRAGYHDQRSIVCASKAEARRLAAFIRPMDEFAVVSVNEAVVVVLTAKSQSVRAMGKAEFQRSKDDVLGQAAAMIGTTPEALQRERAA